MPYEITRDDDLNIKPISSTLVPGTQWHIVWTSDKRVFFHKQSEKLSVWERPVALKGRQDVDELMKKTPVFTVNSNEALFRSNKSSKSSPSKKKKNEESMQNSDESPTKVQKINEENQRNEISAKITRSNRQKATDEFLHKQRIEASKEAAINAEKEAALIREQLSLEERVKMFIGLLMDKDVVINSKWSIELRKCVFDPRYLLLSSSERKMVYDKYVEDYHSEKIHAEQKKKDDYCALLQEANVNIKSKVDFIQFAINWGKDERFQAIDAKEREPMFDEYLGSMRKTSLATFFKKYL
jgi:transcription elongation regulator 1